MISVDRIPLMMCSGDKNHICFNKIITYMKGQLQGFVMSGISTRIDVIQAETELVIIRSDTVTVTKKAQFGRKEEDNQIFMHDPDVNGIRSVFVES